MNKRRESLYETIIFRKNSHTARAVDYIAQRKAAFSNSVSLQRASTRFQHTFRCAGEQKNTMQRKVQKKKEETMKQNIFQAVRSATKMNHKLYYICISKYLFLLHLVSFFGRNNITWRQKKKTLIFPFSISTQF